MGTKLGTAKTCDMRPVNAKPMPMAINAVTIGNNGREHSAKEDSEHDQREDALRAAVLSKDICGCDILDRLAG